MNKGGNTETSTIEGGVLYGLDDNRRIDKKFRIEYKVEVYSEEYFDKRF